MQEVTVRGRTSPREPWRRDLAAADLARMAGTRGDPLLAVQNLPGVGRTPFGLGAFVLRGSDPEDTLVTLESQPIGLAFHLYGLATTLASELVDRVEVLPGNFSARYGRVSGGVVNVVMRAPARDRVRASADLDVLDAGAFASVPLGRRASIAFGARRSWLDGALAVFAPSQAGQSFVRLPRYWDWQVAFDADPSARDAVRLVGSGSDDALGLRLSEPNAEDPSLRGDLSSRTAFHGLQGRWLRRIGARVTHLVAPSVGYQRTVANAGPAVHYDIATLTVGLRDELEFRPNARLRGTLGLDLQMGTTEVALRAPPLSQNGITDPQGATELVSHRGAWHFVNPGLFAELVIDASAALRLVAGLRVDHFSRFGITTVDPRVTATVRLDRRLSARFGLGLYATPPRGYFVLPGFGNPDLGNERWTHVAAGFVMEIVSGVLELTGDAFYKLGHDVVAPSTARVDRGAGLEPLRFANTGEAESIGGEWMLRLHPSRRLPLFGWLAYTHQRVLRRDLPGLPRYPSTWDQPHLLTVLLGASLGRGWELGFRVRSTSGLTEPRVTGALYDTNRDVSLSRVDPADPGRLPAYWALDLRVSKRFRAGPLNLEAVLEVLNATNRSNAESRIYAWDRRSNIFVTGLPIVPSLGLRGSY